MLLSTFIHLVIVWLSNQYVLKARFCTCDSHSSNEGTEYGCFRH